GSVEVAGKKTACARSPALAITPFATSVVTGKAKSRNQSAPPLKLVPAATARASETAEAEYAFTCGSTWNCGNWRAEGFVFCQISMVSLLPFSNSWYWYWNGLPDGTCMNAVHMYCANPPPLAGLESMRYRK